MGTNAKRKKSFEIELYNKRNEKKKIFKEVEPNFLENIKVCTSKIIYCQFTLDFKKGIKLGTGYDLKEQENFCMKLHKANISSNIRTINYKLMLNGLPTNKKFNNKYDKKCYLCNRIVDEDIEHIFVQCVTTKLCFDLVSENYLCNKDSKLSLDMIQFKSGVDKLDFVHIAGFVYCIWITRQSVRNIENHNGALQIFKKNFNKWLISITVI